MKIISNSFKHKGFIPKVYTCDGDDISPHLKWTDVPERTKSFALICDDPDAPVGTWVHWLVCDISPDAREVNKNEVPKNGKEVRNDFRRTSYGGPCPPSGTHRYYFKLYALDLETLKGVSEKNFYSLVEDHKIDEAILMGRYSRK